MTPEAQVGPAPVPAPAADEDSFSARMRERMERLGSLALMTWQVVTRAVSPPYSPSAFIYQLEALGVRSLPIALLTATFAGLVISCLLYTSDAADE